MNSCRVLYLTRYGAKGASSRYRSLQYLPYLATQGFEITVAPLFDDQYLSNVYARKRRSITAVASSLAHRLARMVASRRYDVVWLEKELCPYLPAILETVLIRSGAPLVVDYDDAIFHNYDQHPNPLVRGLLGRKIDKIMRSATVVVAGNAYLAKRATDAGAKRVEILPTVVDADRFAYAAAPQNDVFTIGWIGSPITTRYLEQFRPVLAAACAGGRARFVAVGAAELDWPDVPVEVQGWSEATEVGQLQRFDIGIMPLPDSPWERGKCGFKLIQYMACGRPVVGSPVGVNSQIIQDGINGYLASSEDQWLGAFERLRENAALRQQMGVEGRRIVESRYSIQVAAPKLAEILASFAGGTA